MLTSDHFLGPVTALVFICDRYLVCGTGPHIRVYDVVNGDLVCSRDVLLRNRVHGIRLNPYPGGEEQVELAVFGSTDVCRVVLDRTGRITATFRLPAYKDWIKDVHWLPHGRLALAFAHNFVQIWQVDWIGREGARLLSQSQCQESCLLYAARLMTDPDSGRLQVAAGTIFNEILVWDVAGEETTDGLPAPVVVPVSQRLRGHEGVLFSLQVSPCGHYLGSVSDDRTLRVWNLATGDLRATLFGHAARVWDCCWVDADRIVSVSEDTTARLWSVDQQACLDVWKGHSGRNVWSVAVNPSQRVVATGGGDAGIRLWSLGSSQSEDTVSVQWSSSFKDQQTIRQFRILDVNQMVMENPWMSLGTYDREKANWEMQAVDDSLTGSDPMFHLLAVSPDRRRVVRTNLAGHLEVYSFIESKMELVAEATQTILGKVFSILVTQRHGVSDIYDVLITAQHQGEWQSVWYALQEGTLQRVSRLDTKSGLPFSQTILSMATIASADEVILLCGSRQSTLLLYRIEMMPSESDSVLPVTAILEQAHYKEAVSSLAVQTSSLVVSAGRDGRYTVHRLDRSGKSIQIVKTHSYRVTKGFIEKVLLTPDNELILIYFYDEIMVARNQTTKTDILTVDCGGSKRLWDVQLIQTEKQSSVLCFSYYRNTLLHTHTQVLHPPASVTGYLRSKLMDTTFHGRETRHIRWACELRTGEQLVVTCGEDTCLRFFGYLPTGLREIELVRHKTSTITDVDIVPSDVHKGEHLLFSCGGNEELVCWRLTQTEDGIRVCEASHCPAMSMVPDTRIMSVSVLPLRTLREEWRGYFAVASVTSDSYLYVWVYNERHQTFHVVGKQSNTRNCYLRVRWLWSLLGARVLTTATDGCVFVWDVLKDVESFLDQGLHDAQSIVKVQRDGRKAVRVQERFNSVLCEGMSPVGLKVHQSGVHDVSVLDLNGQIWIASVGDDQRLSLCRYDDHGMHLICACDNAHASAVKGVHLYNKDDQLFALTVSLDQCLIQWKLTASQFTKIDSTYVDVADIGGMDVLSREDSLVIAITGVGLQTFTLNP